MKLLFVVEGFTDIRFVTGLSSIAELTMLTPEREYRSSGLRKRIAEVGARLEVVEIPGGRLEYQRRSLQYLLNNIQKFDVTLAQEMLRGAANACLAGRLRGVPVATFTALPPLEYFACRRARGETSLLRHWAGSALIRFLLNFSGSLNTETIALGEYLRDNAGRFSRRVSLGHYYGVDTDLYSPIDEGGKRALREELDLPVDAFLIFLPSRISHEKDPETVLRATARARQRGLDARLLNLGGGYRDFVDLATRLALPDSQEWVIGRPAAHPMKELPNIYRASDCMALASLEEGLGMSPLEALACGIPAVCTAVGGLARNLPGHARLTPRRDDASMSEVFLDFAANPREARLEALEGRDWVVANWSRKLAFERLQATLKALTHGAKPRSI
jgi:glycosyltransferase involved in cell wall biosynthesis